jgi:hypothetical protein
VAVVGAAVAAAVDGTAIGKPAGAGIIAVVAAAVATDLAAAAVVAVVADGAGTAGSLPIDRIARISNMQIVANRCRLFPARAC